jgi:hypothetical protein
MVNDPEVQIRRIVVQRMEIDDLIMMSQDVDWTVRYEVALRANSALLEKLLNDSDEEVRDIAQQRLAIAAMEN